MAEPALLLHQPPARPWGTVNMSPFGTKLECYLRMAGMAHELRAPAMGKAPKGKIPYVTFPNGEVMGDSQLVIERLERERGAQSLDAWLTDEQRAAGRAVRRMLDEGTYFVGLHVRWGNDASFAVVAKELKAFIPTPLRFLIPIIKGKVRKNNATQGTGRHSDAEIQAIGIEDFRSVATLLGDKPFLFGDKPSTYDTSVFAFVEAMLAFPIDSDVKRFVQSQANLVAYRKRVRDRWFSDLAVSAS